MRIKRKTMRRDEWHGILHKAYAQAGFTTSTLSGIVGLLRFDQVSKPLYVGKEKLCVMGAGITWLELSPRDGYWFLTAMFDREGHLFEYYFDLTDGNHVEANGRVWFHDLFLDVIMTAGQPPRLEDEDELEQALSQGLVTQAQYERTQAEGRRLLEGLLTREPELRAFCQAQRARLLHRLSLPKASI